MFNWEHSDFSANLQEEIWTLSEVNLFTNSILFDVIPSHMDNKQGNQEMIMAVKKKQLCQEEKHVLGISHSDVLGNTAPLLSVT